MLPLLLLVFIVALQTEPIALWPKLSKIATY